MIHGVDATKALLKVALDASALRQQAIANNLANLHSTDYAPLRVNFEEQLGALRAALAAGKSIETSQLAGIRPYVTSDQPWRTGDATTMIDVEMIKMSQNSVYFQSLLKAMQKRGAIMSLAISEGRP